MSMTLPGQTLKRHIENGDISAVISLLKAGNVNLDERDNVCTYWYKIYCV